MKIFALKEKDGKWYYITKDSVTGKQVSKLCKYCKTKEEARDFIKKMALRSANPYLIKNIAKDMYEPGSDHLTILASRGKRPVAITISLKRTFVIFIIQEFGSIDIRHLAVRDVLKRLMNDKFHSGSWKNSYLSILSEIYDYTVFKCPSPVLRPQFLSFARNSRKSDVFFTDEIVRLFKLENWEDYDMYLMFLIIYSCGLRLGEARGLKVNQILFEDKVLVVNGFCSRNGERINHCKKGSDTDRKIRVAPLPQHVLDELKLFITQRQKKADDFLFIVKGKPVQPEYARRYFVKAVEKAGISRKDRKLVPHSLRYTYVTKMRRNLDIESTQKIVGHASPDMTEYYTKSAVQDLIDSLDEKSFEATEKLFE